MKNKIIFLILFLQCFTAYSQNFEIAGFVINKKSREPVSFASICLFNERKGTSTDLDGKFDIQISKKNKLKKLVISSIGFNETIIKISDLKKTDNKILLIPKSYNISEIIIKPIEKKTIIIDKLKKSIFNQQLYLGPSYPKIIAKSFPYKKKYNTYFIKKIRIFFDRWNDSEIEPVFTLRIFEKDSIIGCPSHDLIKKTVVKLNKCQKKNHYVFEYELDKLMTFPKSGVFVGIEWLAIKKNEVIIKEKKYEYKYYSPILKGKSRDKIDNNLWEFYGGNWKLIKTFEKNSEPYIELELSN